LDHTTFTTTQRVQHMQPWLVMEVTRRA